MFLCLTFEKKLLLYSKIVSLKLYQARGKTTEFIEQNNKSREINTYMILPLCFLSFFISFLNDLFIYLKVKIDREILHPLVYPTQATWVAGT